MKPHKNLTHVALWDDEAKQVQGIGRTRVEALQDALLYNVPGLPSTLEETIIPNLASRFSFWRVEKQMADDLEHCPSNPFFTSQRLCLRRATAETDKENEVKPTPKVPDDDLYAVTPNFMGCAVHGCDLPADAVAVENKTAFFRCSRCLQNEMRNGKKFERIIKLDGKGSYILSVWQHGKSSFDCDRIRFSIFPGKPE